MAEDRVIKIELNRTRTDYSKRETTARLELETSKAYRGGVDATAKVYWIGDHFKTHAMSIGGEKCMGDYYKTIARTETTVKATQKAIDTLHAKAFTPEAIEDIKADAIAWYDTQDAAKLQTEQQRADQMNTESQRTGLDSIEPETRS